MKGFIEFIRRQGVVGLAIGFILGGAVSKLVSSLVNDLINPVLGSVLGSIGDLKSQSFILGSVKITWGNFASNLIDFIIILAVVYFVFKALRFEKLDKKD